MNNKLRRVLVLIMVVALLAGLGLTAFATLAGDVNGDGKITVLDAQWIAERDAGLRELTAEQAERAGTFSVWELVQTIFNAEPTEPPATTEPSEPVEPEVPANAVAAVTNDGETTYVTTVSAMQSAVSATGNTQIKLLKDITQDTDVVLPYSCSFDLNGHTVTTNQTKGNGIRIDKAGSENKTATVKNGTVNYFTLGIRVAEGALVVDNMQIHGLSGACVGLYDPAAEYKTINSITNSVLSSPFACVTFNANGVDFSTTGLTIANTDLITHKSAAGKAGFVIVKNGNTTKFANVFFGENVNMYAYADQPVDANRANTFFNGKIFTREASKATVTANGKTYADMNHWTTAAEEEPIKILMIGNSFCQSFTEELRTLAEEAGKDVYIANLYYAGCSVKQHWERLNGQDTTEYHGFFVTDTFGRNQHGTIKNIKDAVHFQDWDIISLQQHFSLARTVSYEEAVKSCTPYVSNLYGYMRENFPDAKLYWHQTWAFELGYQHTNNTDDDPTNDNPDLNVPTLEVQNRQQNNIIAASNWVSQTYNVDQIPSGSAWVIARANPNIADDPCKDDMCHDGTVEGGQYLNACTWFETLFGESCIGKTQFVFSDYTLDATLAAELQKAAHQAVADMYGEDYAQ